VVVFKALLILNIDLKWETSSEMLAAQA